MNLFVSFFFFFLFFFKQKTAYEMLRSLVGSEMCIRDRCMGYRQDLRGLSQGAIFGYRGMDCSRIAAGSCHTCLLYTSDAADDLLCVDLGGRRIIKKKNITSTNDTNYLTMHYHHRHSHSPQEILVRYSQHT